MRKVLTLALLFVFLLGTDLSFARVLLYDDAENSPYNRDWLMAGTGGKNSLTVTSEKSRSGSKSYKFVLAPYGTSSTETNVELVLRGLNSPVQVKNFLYNREYWMGWSVYIPSDFKFPENSRNDWGLLGQFHGTNDSCDKGMGPPIALFTDSKAGAIKVSIQATDRQCSNGSKLRDQSYPPSSLRKGAWNDIVVNCKFNYANSGSPFFKLWMNGKLVVNDSGANCYNDAKPPYLKLGIYANSPNWMTVYYDEIRIGDASSSYNEVAPSGSASGGSAPAPAPDVSSSLEAPTLRIVQ